jgi:hypothetical protein
MAGAFGRLCAAPIAGLLLCTVVAAVTRAAEPRYAVHLQDTQAPRPVTTAPVSQPVTIVLDGLENQLVSVEAGNANADLAAIAVSAQQALSRATTASERIRARRVLRRVRHLTEGHLSDGTPTREFDVAAAGYSESSALAPPGSRIVDGTSPAPSTSQSLERLAQAAARLAQYGAPTPAIDPACAPVVMAAPVAVACAPPPTRHYLNLDALGWWVKGDQLPALVTTAPIGTEQSVAGVLGEPTTSVLYGNEKVNDGLRWGGRVQGGVWLDDFQTIAVEGHYYGLATQTASFSQTSVFSDGSLDDAILARPFFDTNPLVNANSAELVAFPDFQVPIVLPPVLVDLDGTIDVQEQSRIQSAGAGIRYALGAYSAPARLFLVGGYRFFDLNESLTITANTSDRFQFFPFPDDGVIQVYDSFSTRNIFNGGEIGIGGELTRNRLSLGAETRLAMGNMNQQLTIDGRTSAIYDVYVASYEGGLLAQPSNIGTFTQNKFALIPQIDVKVGYQLLPALRATVGYNFTYISNVIRPGEQVDLNVNSSQFAGLPLVGPADPAVLMDTTSIWLQGFTMGVDLRF